MIETTLIYLRKDNKILLGKKLRGFGMGKITGVGGKFEEGETPAECAIRETYEETGVTITKFEEVGRIVYDDLHYKGTVERELMYVFIATEWEGEPKDSDELDLEWYALRDIPYNKMWSDAKEYMPTLLRGEHFEAYFHYNEKNEYTDFWVKPCSDELLAEPKDSDFGFKSDCDFSTAPTRIGARAVLLDNKGRVCLSWGKNKGYFKLPGGGRDKGELAYENVAREVREEVGYTIRDIVPLGRVIEYRGSLNKVTDSHGFLCRVDSFVGAKLEEDEIEDGMQEYWAESIDDALRVIEEATNNVADSLKYRIHFWNAREMAFLRKAKQILNKQQTTGVIANNETDEDYGTERGE